MVYCLLAAGIAVLLFRNYHRRIKKANQEKIELLHFEKEKELYEAKMKFFTNIAHEIKTPLTLIKAPLERVIKAAEAIPGIKSSLAIMQRNTDRLVELTAQLLDYRQTEAGGFIMTFGEVNISRLLQETYFLFKPLADQKKLSYKLYLPKDALHVNADSEAVTKILNNLLSNAIKYADMSVKVSLNVPVDKNTFSIEIQNDGFLIPAEMNEKIFEPFFRLKNTEKQKGTGIGLALARSLAELHGGHLRLKENTTRNCFVLTLPVAGEIKAMTERENTRSKTLLETNK